LWPAFVDVPDGWTVTKRSDSRASCLQYIEEHWTNMRPNSLMRQMKEGESEQ
jgi:MbtH protein